MTDIAERQMTASAAAAATAGRASALIALKQAAPVTLGLVLAWLLYRRIGQLDTDHLFAAFATLSVWQWTLAVLATGVSFRAIGTYDVILHRLLASPVPARHAARGARAAIALSQAVGLGVLTGAVVRWRMLPGFGFLPCLRLSLAVALSFLAGWALITAAALTLMPLPQIPRFLPPAVLALAAGALLVTLWQPHLYWRGRRIGLPPLAAMARLAALVAIDMLAAALAFRALLPAEAALAFTVLLPAFLVAFGAGLTSGTPGGIGAFDITLLMLLPQTPQAPLLAAILAFRLVYFVLPAGLAMLAVFIGPARFAPIRSALRAPARHDIEAAPFAEANLLSGGELAVLRGNHGAALSMVAPRGQSLIALGPVLTPQSQAHALTALAAEARWHFLQPCLYKADARLAARARRSGWSVRAISAEALVTPARFDPARPECRQLRRKLRQAEKAGVTVCLAETHQPLAQMGCLSAQWAAANGGERGFSMGRYNARSMAGQRIYLAYRQGRLVGFASFNTGRRDWSLDLMRSGPQTPPGTMHALVVAAIGDAAVLGAARLSLAAAPLVRGGPGHKAGRALRGWFGLDPGDGLYQFKAAFAPDWRRLYLATPHAWAMILAGFDILRAILSPPRPS